MTVVNPINIVMGEVTPIFSLRASTLSRILNTFGAHWMEANLWAIR